MCVGFGCSEPSFLYFVLNQVFLLLLKFRFSKKVTKFDVYLVNVKSRGSAWEIVSNFCGLSRMSELYLEIQLLKITT